jgi:hypothetical protein
MYTHQNGNGPLIIQPHKNGIKQGLVWDDRSMIQMACMGICGLMGHGWFAVVELMMMDMQHA